MSDILGNYLITNVSFGQDGMRIEYLEQRTQTEGGGIESALVLFELDEEKVVVIQEIQSVLNDFIVEYFENLPDRNRPDVLPDNRFQRLRKTTDLEGGEE